MSDKGGCDHDAWRHRPIDLAKLARMAPFPGEFDRVAEKPKRKRKKADRV